MKTRSTTKSLSLLTPALLAATALFASCSTTKNDVRAGDKPGAQGDAAMMQLPPGWTAEDMQACMLAGTPGEMHKHLAKSVGTWKGTNTMWMAPGTPPMTSESTCSTTLEMDGRFVKTEFSGDMPGMGAFRGLGFNGYDNVAQKFVSTWLDNHGTGIMMGEGSLSPDGKTMTWNFRYNDPVTKKPAVMREVERHPSDDAMSLEMYGNDPKSGVEFKMMQIDMKRTGGKIGS